MGTIGNVASKFRRCPQFLPGFLPPISTDDQGWQTFVIDERATSRRIDHSGGGCLLRIHTGLFPVEKMVGALLNSFRNADETFTLVRAYHTEHLPEGWIVSLSAR